MSRFQLYSSIPGTTVHVGWDSSLHTFYAQVRGRPKAGTDEPIELLAVGKAASECLTIKDLSEQILPWASVPSGTATAMERERDRTQPPLCGCAKQEEDHQSHPEQMTHRNGEPLPGT